MNVLELSSLLVRPCRKSLRTARGLFTGLILLLGIMPLCGQTVSKVHARDLIAAQPLWFEPTPDAAGMVSRFEHRSFQVETGGTVRIGARTGKTQTEVTVSLDGASQTASVSGTKPATGRSNYFLGRNPAAWRRGVSHFAGAKVADVYPGIDVTYYGNGTSLEYDYLVAPQRDPEAIRLRADGETRLDGRSGDLLVTQAKSGTELLRLHQPVAYQLRQDGTRVTIAVGYARNDDASFGFKLGSYDHTRPLIIDPVITYSTYFGGSGFDEIKDIKTDAAGDIYLLVETNSIDLPDTKQIAGACASGCGPGNPSNSAILTQNNDIYVAKLDPTGKTLLFSTYIGGSSDDIGGSFALGSDGAIYIAGQTGSSDFPLVNQYSNQPLKDAFGNVDYSTTLTKLSADGSKILYSSLLGGGLVQEAGNCCRDAQNAAQPGSVAVGADGIAYLIGFAATNNEGYGFGNFKDQKGAGTTTQGDGSFLAKFDTTKSGNDSLIFALPYGLPTAQEGMQFTSMAIDSRGNVWTIGQPNHYATITPTSDALQPVCDTGDPNNCDNFYLVEIAPDGGVIYATYFGGTVSSDGGPGTETANNIFLDASDNIYVTGGTISVDFPLKNAAYTTLVEGDAAFLTKFAPGGKSILYSTYARTSLALVSALSSGIAAIAGENGGGAPVVNGITGHPPLGYFDAYWEVFDTTKAGASSLLTASYLGTTGFLNVFASTVDAQGNLLFGGDTNVSTLPVVNAYQSTCNANCFVYGSHAYDGFVTRVQIGASTGSITLVPTTQTFPSTAVGATSAALTSTLTNTTSLAFAFTPSFTDSTDFKETDTCSGMVAAGASCTFSFTFAPQSTGPLTSTFTLAGATSPSTTLAVALSGTATGSASLTITPSTYAFGSVASGSNPVTQTLVLKNTGNVADNAVTFQFSESDQGPQTPSLTYGANCASLAAGATCNIVITFTPHVGVTATGTLTVNGGTGVTAAVATITGAGTAAVTATLTPSTVSFGNVTVGTTTVQTITLKNTSPSSESISNFNLSGAGLTQTTTCGASLATNATCAFTITYAPTAAGPVTGSLTVSDAAGTQIATISGMGVAPAAPTFAPSPLNFGNVTLGATGTKTVTLTNPGPAAYSVPISGFTTYAPINGNFAVAGGTCTAGLSVASGASCNVILTYTPTTAGPASAAFYFFTVGSEPGATLTLTATGMAQAAPVFAPSPLDFGNVTVGATGTKTVMLTNPGPTAYSVPISGFTTYAPINGNFAVAGGTCTADLSVASGASCTVILTYTPTTAGSASAAFYFFTVGSEPGATLNLTATGVAPAAPTLSPATLNLGNVPIGTSVTKAVTLTNPSSVTVPVPSYGLGGYLADMGNFDFYSGTCATVKTLAAGASCIIQITYTPFADGVVSDTLGLFPNPTVQTVVTATGVGQPVLTPATLDFGSVAIGTTSTVEFLTYTNRTSASYALPNSLFTITGGLGTFAVSGGTCVAGTNMVPGASCTVGINYAPTTVGAATGAFAFVFNTLLQGGTANLIANGITPGAPTLTPAKLDLGNVAIGTSVTKVVTLTNPSSVAVPVPSYGLGGYLANLGSFDFYNGTCATVKTLAAGASCTIQITYTPLADGVITDTLGLFPYPTVQTAITATGVGLPVLTPATLDFGSVAVGTTSPVKFLTYTNRTSATYVLPNNQISTDFSLGTFALNGGTCVSGTTIAAGASCTVGVTYTAKTAGVSPGRFFFLFNTLLEGGNANLAANGITPPAPTLTPAALDLGNVSIGTSATKVVTLSNPNSIAVPVPSYGLGGYLANLGSFDFYSGTCAMVKILAPGASCTIQITYTPISDGVITDTLALFSYPTVQTVVTAAGAGQPVLTPATLDFGSVALGTTSPVEFLTYTNRTSAAYALPNSLFTITSGLGTFAINGGTCVAGTNMVPGASCTVGITYGPTVIGAATGAFTFVFNSLLEGGTANLTANGMTIAPPSPDFTITTPTSAAITVNRGSSANLIIQIGSASASTPDTSPVTFSMTSLPAGVTATFSPSSVTPGTKGGSTTLTFNATASSAQNKPMSPLSPRGRETAFDIAAAALMAGLFGLRRRLNVRLLLCLCTIGVMTAMIGCGSGNNSSAPASASYVVVTATSGSITHTITVALTVQ